MYGFLFDLNKKGEGEILIQNVDICGPEAIFFRQIVEKTQPTFLCNIFLYKFFSESEATAEFRVSNNHMSLRIRMAVLISK